MWLFFWKYFWWNWMKVKSSIVFKHVHYCQSDTDRESTWRPDKLLRTVNILYGPSLFVSAMGDQVKGLICKICQQLIRSVQSVRIVREFTTRQTVTDRKFYGPSLFVSAEGGWVYRALLNCQDMPTIRTVRTIRHRSWGELFWGNFISDNTVMQGE